MARSFEHMHVLTLELGNWKMVMFGAPLVPGNVRLCFTVAQLSSWIYCPGAEPSLALAANLCRGCFILTNLNESSQTLLGAAPGIAWPQAEPGEAEIKIPLWCWHLWLLQRLPRLWRY